MSVQRPAGAAGRVRVGEREVARIGYGMGGLTDAVAAGHRSFEDGVALLRHAVDLGVDFYDTAQFYGSGLANRLLDAAFGGSRTWLMRPRSAPARWTARSR